MERLKKGLIIGFLAAVVSLTSLTATEVTTLQYGAESPTVENAASVGFYVGPSYGYGWGYGYRPYYRPYYYSYPPYYYRYNYYPYYPYYGYGYSW